MPFAVCSQPQNYSEIGPGSGCPHSRYCQAKLSLCLKGYAKSIYASRDSGSIWNCECAIEYTVLA